MIHVSVYSKTDTECHGCKPLLPPRALLPHRVPPFHPFSSGMSRGGSGTGEAPGAIKHSNVIENAYAAVAEAVFGVFLTISKKARGPDAKQEEQL